MVFIDIKVRIIKFFDKFFKFIDGQGMYLLINFNGLKYW